jgi:hypothetical protein
MKAYTLRMDEDMLTSIKQLGLKEKKSIKEIILEALQERVYQRATKSQDLKEKKLFQRAAMLASRLSDKQVLDSIHEDRNR